MKRNYLDLQRILVFENITHIINLSIFDSILLFSIVTKERHDFANFKATDVVYHA